MKLNYMLLFILILLFSCSKDKKESITEPGQNSTGTFKAEIDGSRFDAYEVKAYPLLNYIVIEGEDETNREGYSKVWIKIFVRNLNEPRIYAIGEDGNGLIYNARATINYIDDANKDTLIYTGYFVEEFSLIDVTELNSRRISGKVEFLAHDKKAFNADTIDFREGRFSITF